MVVQARVAEYIEKKGIMRKFIAKKTGMTNSKLSEIMSGKRELKADDLEKICNVLNVDPNKFVHVQTEEEDVI
ncbi:MAG: helix-turn-helix domain-containing protein [Bacteroidota bacterium]|nr:helix-turn-helix domain-containing protein [Bacteroidota bacterium]